MSNPLEPTAFDTEVALMESTKVDLVARAKEGDTNAFGSLVRMHQRQAVSVAFRLLGNTEDASDVAQDAFVRAFRSLGQLEDPARFGPWLLRTVSNLALNFRRARAHRKAAPLEDTAVDAAEVRHPGTGLRLARTETSGDDTLPTELHAAVSAALEKLPEKQRLALILFSVEQMPQKDVAAVLGCSVELVKWNVFQARRKLRELLAEHL